VALPKLVLCIDMSSAQDHGGHPRERRTGAERTKREEILSAAIARFSRDGYEDTKWADIAADVGVGPTALYHYFDSKQHCLFVILDDALRDALARFERITAAEPDFEPALQLVVADAFDLTVLDIQRLRVLEAEHGLLARRHISAREGQNARQTARARTRDLELAWATFLERAMDAGAVRRSDPRLLARAVLGLYNSIWHWYRPEGIIPLEVVAAFYRAKMLGVMGAEPPLSEGLRAA
jgi:TetR/AcrR family transcriptional regulator, cholesterol catabolism regulator